MNSIAREQIKYKMYKQKLSTWTTSYTLWTNQDILFLYQLEDMLMFVWI